MSSLPLKDWQEGMAGRNDGTQELFTQLRDSALRGPFKVTGVSLGPTDCEHLWIQDLVLLDNG